MRTPTGTGQKNIYNQLLYYFFRAGYAGNNGCARQQIIEKASAERYEAGLIFLARLCRACARAGLVVVLDPPGSRVARLSMDDRHE